MPAKSRLVSRSKAQARGWPRYFTGNPCKHGHVDDRYTRDKTCVECVRLRKVRKSPGRYTLGTVVPVTEIRNFGSKDLSPREQWVRTVRAARRQRLMAFGGCTTFGQVLKRERTEMAMQRHAQRAMEADRVDV